MKFVNDEKFLSHQLPIKLSYKLTALIIIRLCTDLILQSDSVAVFFAIFTGALYCNLKNCVFSVNIEVIIMWISVELAIYG